MAVVADLEASSARRGARGGGAAPRAEPPSGSACRLAAARACGVASERRVTADRAEADVLRALAS